MNYITDYEQLQQKKGKYKVIITNLNKIVGKSVLYFLEYLIDNTITNCSNNIFLTDRKLLSKIESNSDSINKFNYKLRCLKESMKSKDGINIKHHFPILPVIEQPFSWNEIEFFVTIDKVSDNTIVNLSNSPLNQVYDFLYTMIITTDNSKEIINEFILEAYDYYKKFICEDITFDSTTKIKIFNDSHWENFQTIPKRKLSTVYLPKQISDKFKKYIDNWTSDSQEKWYEEMGIPYKCNILLHGYPGTGKTSLIKGLASYLKYNLYLLNFNKDLDDTKMMNAIKKVKSNSILVMEDIDCLFVERKKDDNYKNQISFSGLLNILDGIASKIGLITILTTNYKVKLDKALTRPGRIDLQIEFGYANKHQIESMFNKFFPDKKDIFKQFWTKIKKIKLTMCVLQNYFFQCHQSNEIDIIENIDELKKIAEENSYDNQYQTQLYM